MEEEVKEQSKTAELECNKRIEAAGILKKSKADLRRPGRT